MIIIPESHVDHVSPAVLAFVMEQCGDHNEPFNMVRLELPVEVTASCDLYGPVMGDEPITDDRVTIANRSGRDWKSRLIDLPPRPVNYITVVYGEYKGQCVLFTVYGGPTAPPEVDDPSQKTKPIFRRAESAAFWADHALSSYCIYKG